MHKPIEKCEWCKKTDFTVNRPLPGSDYVRLLLCDECERIVARQIALTLQTQGGA